MKPVIRKLIDIAFREVGTKEVGNNDGPRIVEYQKATWLEVKNFPYCAAFCCWLLQQWVKDPEVCGAIGLKTKNDIQKFLCRDPRAFGWEKWARDRGFQVLPEVALAKAGDFVVFDFSHIGIVIEDQKSGSHIIRTVEANTNATGSREGDGVWKKIRNRTLVKSYIRIFS